MTSSSPSSLLRVTHLRKAFGGNQAVNDVSFDLAPGELLALIGPNGAGKTTTFNLLNGQLRPDSGDIFFEGTSLIGRTPHELSHLGIARTFQVAQTFASFTTLENVQLALLCADHQATAVWSRAANYRRASALSLLEQVGLVSHAERACAALAYGDVKRLELAMALASSPRLLLMDEPTAGMAPAERNALMVLVRRLVLERRISVLFTEHSMDVVFKHADRVLVMARGTVMAHGSPQQVSDDPQVRSVYLGRGTLAQHARGQA